MPAGSTGAAGCGCMPFRRLCVTMARLGRSPGGLPTAHCSECL